MFFFPLLPSHAHPHPTLHNPLLDFVLFAAAAVDTPMQFSLGEINICLAVLLLCLLSAFA